MVRRRFKVRPKDAVGRKHPQKAPRAPSVPREWCILRAISRMWGSRPNLAGGKDGRCSMYEDKTGFKPRHHGGRGHTLVITLPPICEMTL
jgi:hypothetical protein